MYSNKQRYCGMPKAEHLQRTVSSRRYYESHHLWSLSLSTVSIVGNHIAMVDRRRWPTAAYFHTQHLHYEGDHTSSIFREQIPDHIEETAGQEQQSRNPGQVLSVDERIRELYWSTLQFENDEDFSWDFDRLMGFGSFGIAASYQKRNINGDVVDVCTSCRFVVRSLHEADSRCKIPNTPGRLGGQFSSYWYRQRGISSRSAQFTKPRPHCRPSWIQVFDRRSLSHQRCAFPTAPWRSLSTAAVPGMEVLSGTLRLRKSLRTVVKVQSMGLPPTRGLRLVGLPPVHASMPKHGH